MFTGADRLCRVGSLAGHGGNEFRNLVSGYALRQPDMSDTPQTERSNEAVEEQAVILGLAINDQFVLDNHQGEAGQIFQRLEQAVKCLGGKSDHLGMLHAKECGIGDGRQEVTDEIEDEFASLAHDVFSAIVFSETVACLATSPLPAASLVRIGRATAGG